MGCLEHELSLFNLPTETKQWMPAAKNSGKWFRRVEEAAEQYMKRWFATVENAAKRRALEVQTAQQLKTSLGPRLGRGRRKRSRVEGSVAKTAARPVKKVKAPAETWQWLSF